MSNYKKILLATDLSGPSGEIAARAHQIAKESGAQLNILHIIEHSPVTYGDDFFIPIDINLEQSIETQARAALAKLAKSVDVPEEYQFVESGSVKVLVSEFAKKIKADLIVAGSHQKTGLDFLLGSRATAILHTAPCDVLIVKSHHTK